MVIIQCTAPCNNSVNNLMINPIDRNPVDNLMDR